MVYCDIPSHATTKEEVMTQSGKKTHYFQHMMPPRLSSRRPSRVVYRLTPEDAEMEIRRRFHYSSNWVREGGEVVDRVSPVTSRNCAQAEWNYAVYFGLETNGLTQPEEFLTWPTDSVEQRPVKGVKCPDSIFNEPARWTRALTQGYYEVTLFRTPQVAWTTPETSSAILASQQQRRPVYRRT